MTSVVSEATWAALLERDDYKCLRCGSEEGLQPAHYISRGSSGSDDLENIMLLCGECHRALHDGKLRVREISGRFFFAVARS